MRSKDPRIDSGEELTMDRAPDHQRRIFYIGTYLDDEYVVVKAVDRRTTAFSAEKSLDLAKHSPDGFAWGYAGSGPAQLALAILFDVTGDKDLSLEKYTSYMHQVISRLGSHFSMSASSVRDWLMGAK